MIVLGPRLVNRPPAPVRGVGHRLELGQQIVEERAQPYRFVEGPGGRRVDLEAKRVDDVEGLVSLALDQEG